MNRLLCVFVLTAQRSRLDELGSVFRKRPSQVDAQYVLTGLLVLAGIVLGMWLLAQLLARQDRRRSRNSAWMLFFSLAKAHALSWTERWLLWRVARHQRLRDPARLFLEPERLAGENLSAALRLRQVQLTALRGRLFADLRGTNCEAVLQGAPRGMDGPAVVQGPSTRPAEKPPMPPATSPPRAAREQPAPGFPVAGNPALDVPPWVGP